MKSLIFIFLIFAFSVFAEPFRYDIEYQPDGPNDPRIGTGLRSGYSWTDHAYGPVETLPTERWGTRMGGDDYYRNEAEQKQRRDTGARHERFRLRINTIDLLE